MQRSALLHNILKESGAVNHSTRLNSLLNSVESLMKGADLTLTSLGRRLATQTKPKYKIKKLDYLLSNPHINRERFYIYKALNEWLASHEKLVFIIIDWSSVVPHEHHVLRASLIRKGRAVTVYEEIHPESQLGKGGVHASFLKTLKAVLPENLEVCIVVDAGFKTDFFIQVETENWDYVGRVLSNMHYTLLEQEAWEPTADLYAKATSEPQDIGAVQLAKSNKCVCNLSLYKKISEEAVNKENVTVRKIKHGKKEKEHKNAALKPWLIASSLKISAIKIMLIYKKRMKIEHDFRDSKDPKWGLGLRRSGTKNPLRLEILLLIAFLATVLLWLMGLCLEAKGLHRDFQANSIKNKRVLSLIYLALEAIQNGYIDYINETDFWEMKKIGLYDEDLNCANFVGIT